MPLDHSRAALLSAGYEAPPYPLPHTLPHPEPSPSCAGHAAPEPELGLLLPAGQHAHPEPGERHGPGPGGGEGAMGPGDLQQPAVLPQPRGHNQPWLHRARHGDGEVHEQQGVNFILLVSQNRWNFNLLLGA